MPSDERTSSTETLVNPSPVARLVITKPNPLVTVLNWKDRPRYMIATVDATGAKTTFSDPRTKDVFVKLRRGIFRGDEITLLRHEGGKTMKVRDWLKERQMGNVRIWDIETSSGKFIWRTDPAGSLVFCSLSDLDNPIARVEYSGDGYTPSALVLPLRRRIFWDVIVAGWFVVEGLVQLKRNKGSGSFCMG